MFDAEPEGWKQKALGEVITLEYGRALPEASRLEGSVPVYGSNGPVGSHADHLVGERGIVVGRKGTAGSVHVTSGAFWPIDTTYYVKPRGEVDFDWLAAVLRHADLGSLNEATGVPGLNRENAYRRPVLVPPLDEQRRIAEVLRSVDEATRSVGKVADSARNTFNLLIGALHEEHADNLVPLSTLCVPKGLQTGPFGSQLKVSDYVEGGVPVLMPSDLKPDGIDFSGAKTTSSHKFSQLRQHALQPGDILFSRRGDVEKCGIYLDGHPPAMCGTGCLRARIDPNAVDPILVYFLVQSDKCGAWLKQHAVGVTMPNLNTGIIGALPVPNVPKEKQAEWGEALRIAEHVCRTSERQVAELEALKVAVADDLLSGRVRVPA